jgi:hypothetical protein
MTPSLCVTVALGLAGCAARSDGRAIRSGPAALMTRVAPGGNFDLSLWALQEPVGSPGRPRVITPARLVGPDGYQDEYFFTSPADGAMTFWDPENGVTTLHSRYPRSELRELNADGSDASWPISGTNRLSASVAVTQVPDHVCIGQLHVGEPIQLEGGRSTKPILELYYYRSGDIAVGIEDGAAGGQTIHHLSHAQLAQVFRYTIEVTGDGVITIAIDGASASFTMPRDFSGYGAYFKAGAYDQSAGMDPTVGATVKFYALHVSHER